LKLINVKASISLTKKFTWLKANDLWTMKKNIQYYKSDKQNIDNSVILIIKNKTDYYHCLQVFTYIPKKVLVTNGVPTVHVHLLPLSYRPTA
jgi:hypothetical protein